ncbi:MAG TPA: hypothetical protein VGG48_16495 [Rhizomicrobium sp.]|jgi:hypothetical protein
MGQFVLRPRVIAAAVLFAGFLASAIVNWPGHLEFDGVMQLLEGRTGLYSNWHPPIMSWLLGLSDALTHGAGLFVLFDTAMAFGAMLAILWLAPKPGWLAAAAAVVVIALPQLFLFQAIVWKDLLFADACVAGFVCLAQAAVRWEQPRARFAWLGGGVLFVTLAVLARQNGFVILPCAALALGLAAPRHRPATAAAFFVACIGLALGANALLQLRATDALGATEQFEDLELYDIAGMMKRDPSVSLPILDKEAPALARIMHAKGPALYTPAGHDALSDESGMGEFIIPALDAVKRQWRALVWAHPLDYVAVRSADFAWLFTSTHPDECMTYIAGVDGPDEQMHQLGLVKRFDDRDTFLDDNYAGPLIETPALSHPFFAVVGLVCLILLLRRRRPADLAMAGLLVSTMLYTASYFVIALACEYRYLFVIDLSTIAAAFYLAMDILRTRAQQRTQAQ